MEFIYSSILCEGNRLKIYEFIREYHLEFGVNWLLDRFNLYPNDYYNYLKDRKSTYRQQKEALKRHIKNTYHELNGTVGYRMICDLLNRKAIQCSYGTVYSNMREMGIKAIVRRKSSHKLKAISIIYLIICLNRILRLKNRIWSGVLISRT